MKRIIAFTICLCLMLSLPLSVFANEAVTVSSECDISDIDVPLSTDICVAPVGTVLEISAKSAILLEPKTGEILYDMNSDEQVAPASITKIMSLLLIMEAIDSGDLSTETVITASEHACSMGGSQIWLEPGESMTVDDLLKATVIASANDACVALGEAIAGSEEGFVDLMNKRAKELSMTGTTFKNCTGLDEDGHMTTAHDVALMSAELIKHPLIKNYSTVWMDTLRDGKSELVNTNKLVRFYNGTTGLKTGTTSKAGCCLAATAERGGLSLVAVVMDANTSTDRFEGAKKLLDFGFANYEFSTLDAALTEKSIGVEGGVQKKIGIYSDGKIDLLINKKDRGKVERSYEWVKNLSAPIKKGQTVGYTYVYVGDEEVGRIEIKAQNSVKKITVLVAAGEILKKILNL